MTALKAMIAAEKSEWVYIFTRVRKIFLKINRMNTPILVKKYFATKNGSSPCPRK
jgi:hypothetical protein